MGIFQKLDIGETMGNEDKFEMPISGSDSLMIIKLKIHDEDEDKEIIDYVIARDLTDAIKFMNVINDHYFVISAKRVGYFLTTHEADKVIDADDFSN